MWDLCTRNLSHNLRGDVSNFARLIPQGLPNRRLDRHPLLVRNRQPLLLHLSLLVLILGVERILKHHPRELSRVLGGRRRRHLARQRAQILAPILHPRARERGFHLHSHSRVVAERV